MRRGLRGRLAIGSATLAVTVGVVLAVYNIGDRETDPEPAESQATATQDLSRADQARVGRLMRRVAADPDDAVALIRLGDVFFAAGDYDTAGAWMERAVAAAPRNVRARLALGAARFNAGDADTARRQWLEVIEIDPDNVEAHYDLGFLYLSRKPPDTEAARRMWSKVIELEPDSALAGTIATHLEGLDGR